ncbi:MAG: acyltransferase [Solirubrobacterales bacterium]|nr:acyltransferase [Solirubrobacterales bacterium]
MREDGTSHHIADPGKEARSRAGIPIVPAFDGFRAFAILGVVAIHLIQISGLGNTVDDSVGRLLWGSFGRAVEALFIISGFVVYLPTAARGGEFGRFVPYAIRRGARLLPAYWLIIAFSILLLAVFTVYSPVLRDQVLAVPDLGNIALNLTTLAVPASMLSSDVSVGMGIDPPLWTLSSELIFYLVLPLVAVLFFRRPILALALSAAITVAWMLAFDNLQSLTEDLGMSLASGEQLRLGFASEQQFPTWAFSFALGMCGALAWVRLTQSRIPAKVMERRAGLAAAASLAVAIVTGFILGGDAAFTREQILGSMVFSVALAVLMVALTLCPPGWQRPFTASRVRQLGDISYGIYLSHYVFITLAVSAFALPADGTVGDFLLLELIVLPPTVLYGYLSARFLEQPVRRWARKYGAATRTKPDGAGPSNPGSRGPAG